MGRPTILTDELKANARAYILQCEDEETEYHKTRGEKSDSFERVIRVKIPSIEGLALHLRVARSMIYEWEKIDEEFSDIIDELRAKQAKMLIENGLGGTYNPTIAKVLLTKHGYREGQELTGKDGKDLVPEPLSKEKEEELKGLL